MRLNKIEDLVGKTVKIIATQTTFMVVNFQQVDYQINFDKKEEFLLKKGTEGILHIELQHPLLTNYQEDFIETFINSRYSNPEELLKIFEQTINEQTKGYRDWKTYFEIPNLNYTIQIVKNNIEKGTGKLCSAPISISNKIVEQCNLLNIKTKTFDEKNFKIKPYKLLTIGNNYVIAMDFKVKN